MLKWISLSKKPQNLFIICNYQPVVTVFETVFIGMAVDFVSRFRWSMLELLKSWLPLGKCVKVPFLHPSSRNGMTRAACRGGSRVKVNGIRMNVRWLLPPAPQTTTFVWCSINISAVLQLLFTSVLVWALFCWLNCLSWQFLILFNFKQLFCSILSELSVSNLFLPASYLSCSFHQSTS